MIQEDMRAEVSFTAAMVTFIAALFIWWKVDPAAAEFFIDGGAPDWARYMWWTCGAIMFAIMWRAGTLGGNILGTIMVVAFGPVSLLTMVYQKIWYTLSPVRREASE